MRCVFPLPTLLPTTDCARRVDRNELAAAKGVLERVAIHHGVLVELVKERGGGEDDSAELSRLACWFFTLRMRDSWMQKNSMLEMMYQKAAAEPAARRDVQTGEELARALAGIGGDMLREKTYPLAIQWLQRAFGVLGSAEVMNLSDMGSELRMQTAHKLGNTLPPSLQRPGC